MLVSFVLSFFPRDVLDEILNLIGSVSEGFPSYSCLEILNNPPTKVVWTVREAVNKYWVATVKSQADLYSSLQWLNTGIYRPGVCHPLVTSSGDLREVSRKAVKLKIVTGTYILQTTVELHSMRMQ